LIASDFGSKHVIGDSQESVHCPLAPRLAFI
jgi:hypothetical protein